MAVCFSIAVVIVLFFVHIICTCSWATLLDRRGRGARPADPTSFLKRSTGRCRCSSRAFIIVGGGKDPVCSTSSASNLWPLRRT